MSFGDTAMQQSENISPSPGVMNLRGISNIEKTSSDIAYEVKRYTANINSKNPESDCVYLATKLEEYHENVKIENRNTSKNSCNLTFKIIKGKESLIIDFLKTHFHLQDMSSDITNIIKPFVQTTDKIAELNKNLADVDMLLNNSKSQYDELWNALKKDNASATSIDALNKIILNKSELISKFSRERNDILEQIDNLNKQKVDYEEQIKFVTFSVYFSKQVLFDFDQLKTQWFSDTRELVTTFNDTIRNLSVNLIDFLLKTFNVVIYIVLGSFFVLTGGKFLYHMGRRILLGKEGKKK